MFGPFIYTCEKSIEVYKTSTTYIEQGKYAKKIEQLAWTYHSVGDVIPHTEESMFSGHFFPWSESWNELQISFDLCLFGLYKQAMVSVRSGLELGLLSVYWNLQDDGHIIIRQWLKSQKETPRLNDIWKRLEAHNNFRVFQAKYDIKSRLLKLNYLHDYAHSKGYKFSNSMGTFKSNFQTFQERSFEAWFEAFQETIEVLAILHLVKYPIGVIELDYDSKFGIDKPMFGGLDVNKIERIKDTIGQEAFSSIEDISKDDATVQDIIHWVSNLPDMTEEDFEAQIVEFDKGMIEHQGWESWLEQEKMLMGDKFAQTERHKQRVERLNIWAKENGFEKPAWER